MKESLIKRWKKINHVDFELKLTMRHFEFPSAQVGKT